MTVCTGTKRPTLILEFCVLFAATLACRFKRLLSNSNSKTESCAMLFDTKNYKGGSKAHCRNQLINQTWEQRNSFLIEEMVSSAAAGCCDRNSRTVLMNLRTSFAPGLSFEYCEVSKNVEKHLCPVVEEKISQIGTFVSPRGAVDRTKRPMEDAVEHSLPGLLEHLLNNVSSPVTSW